MRTSLLATAAMAVILSATSARAQEESIAVDKLPRPVLDAVKKRFPKAELLEAAKETADGKTEYEVTIKDAGTKIDVMVTPEGKLALIEKAIPAKNLPKAVTNALDAKYPKAQFKIVEEIINAAKDKEVLEFYEVLLVTAEKKTFEVKLTPAGKITETEEKKGKDKD